MNIMMYNDIVGKVSEAINKLMKRLEDSPLSLNIVTMQITDNPYVRIDLELPYHGRAGSPENDPIYRHWTRVAACGAKVTRDPNFPTTVWFLIEWGYSNRIRVEIRNYPCNWTVKCEEVTERKCFRVYEDGHKVELTKEGDEVVE